MKKKKLTFKEELAEDLVIKEDIEETSFPYDKAWYLLNQVSNGVDTQFVPTALTDKPVDDI